MTEFQVGPGILEKMSELGDTPIAHSIFIHPWPNATIEQGFGQKFGYFSDNLDPDNWRTIIKLNDATPTLGLVQAIDVSSHQARDLSPYVELSRAEHAIVRMYQQGVESPSPQHSIAQANSARALGCSVGAYGWLYTRIDQRRQIRLQLDTAALAQLVEPPVLWQDIEHYNGELPTPTEIERGLDECAVMGVRGGVYSSKSIWNELGNPSFPGTALWIADWDGVPELPDDGAAFGGMTIVAKQYTSTAPDGSPLDRNVILREYT